MKQTIRYNTFETNSSSTHSLNIMMKKDFDRWINEDLFLYKGSDFGYEKPVRNKLYTRDEATKFIMNSKYAPEYVDDDTFLDYEFYDSDYEHENLEYYEEEFTTPGGEQIVVFGEYGFAG